METTPIPINQPKVITSMMGSVFGTPMKGVERVAPSNPTTPVNVAVKPALDVLSEKFTTLEAAFKEIQGQLEAMKQDVETIKDSKPIITTTATPMLEKSMGLVPEKKKRGRPKKTV